jgi:hypothetical protein
MDNKESQTIVGGKLVVQYRFREDYLEDGRALFVREFQNPPGKKSPLVIPNITLNRGQ